MVFCNARLINKNNHPSSALEFKFPHQKLLTRRDSQRFPGSRDIQDKETMLESQIMLAIEHALLATSKPLKDRKHPSDSRQCRNGLSILAMTQRDGKHIFDGLLAPQFVRPPENVFVLPRVAGNK